MTECSSSSMVGQLSHGEVAAGGTTDGVLHPKTSFRISNTPSGRRRFLQTYRAGAFLSLRLLSSPKTFISLSFRRETLDVLQ